MRSILEQVQKPLRLAHDEIYYSQKGYVIRDRFSTSNIGLNIPNSQQLFQIVRIKNDLKESINDLISFRKIKFIVNFKFSQGDLVKYFKN